jgi:phosphate uptake regulator
MEMRKVQVTGGSTYIVSLPKKWVKQVGIGPNDTVGIVPQADGTLVLTPRLSAGEELRQKVFDLKEEPDERELLRNLIGAYVTGYDIIEVHQAPRMSTEVRTTVRRFTQLVIGPEIIDEDIDDIRTRDLLSPSDMPFRTSVQRMYRICSAMHREAALAVCELNLDLANDVIMRDTEVDRLDWLVARQYNLLIREVELVERIGTSREHAVNFMLIARILERIGDHSSRIARQVPHLKKARARKAMLKRVKALSEEILPIFDDVISALFERDGKLANDCLERANKVLQDIRKFKSDVADTPKGMGLPLSIVADSLDRTAHYLKDIGELVINYAIDVNGGSK